MLVFGFSSHLEWSKVVHKEQPTFNAISSHKKEDFYAKVRLRIISHNYVGIMFLYLPFNECSYPREISNIQCYPFPNNNTVFIYKVPQ